jgi:hypothetical protein
MKARYSAKIIVGIVEIGYSKTVIEPKIISGPGTEEGG